MQKRILPAAFTAISFITILAFGCTKLDTTTLGQDLVAVDNVNTFADTLTVLATQGVFVDSTLIGKTDNHIIGKITNDPLFGSTEAAIYLQLKPAFFPFYFGNAGDTVKNHPGGSIKAGFDSAFICLAYTGAWGDTSATAIPHKLEVREIIDPQFRDSVEKIRDVRYQPAALDPFVLGSATVTPASAAAQTVFKTLKVKDSVSGQIRIKLDFARANAIFNFDSSGVNGPFKNDSLFRRLVTNGFAITVASPTGNNLMYVNLANIKTRLEFFYHKIKSGVIDTVYQSFLLQPATNSLSNIKASSTANYVKRNYAAAPGSPVTTPSTSHVYLQTSPGTFVNLNFLGLQDMPNRIIHRAYLVAEQDPFDAATDKVYTAPPYVYMDLRDNSTPEKFKPLYFDLNPTSPYAPDQTQYYFPYNNVDPNYFGGAALTRYDGGGTPFTRYELNITRYVQHIVTNHDYNYQLRLYAPYSIVYPQYPATPILGFGTVSNIPFFNPLAFGRVRLGTGSNPVHKMRLVVVYSKVQ